MRRGDDDRFGADVDLQKRCDGPLRAIVLTQHGGLICTVCVSTRRRALCLNMQKLEVCFFLFCGIFLPRTSCTGALRCTPGLSLALAVTNGQFRRVVQLILALGGRLVTCLALGEVSRRCGSWRQFIIQGSRSAAPVSRNGGTSEEGGVAPTTNSSSPNGRLTHGKATISPFPLPPP